MKLSQESSISKDAIILDNYLNEIIHEEDKTLFLEACKSASAGALRGSYIMIWLSCAESIKRKFNEMAQYDGKAGKIVGEIRKKEGEHRSIDKYILEKARDYGFVSQMQFDELNHIYSMRCKYAHPYEQSPTVKGIIYAADLVVRHVLSRPTKLRHGYGQRLLEKLLTNKTYLGDYEKSVIKFTKTVLNKIDDSILGWLLNEYLERLNELYREKEKEIFFRRGVYFCREVLKIKEVELFSEDEWHEHVNSYPYILMHICSDACIFKKIGLRAQESIVTTIFEESNSNVRLLKIIENFLNENVLDERYGKLFREKVLSLDVKEMIASELSLKTCFDFVIKSLKSYDWYIQNPIVDYVMRKNNEIINLDEGEQEELGRNIYQSAEGSANSSIRYINNIKDKKIVASISMLTGMLLEAFVNEKNIIRFKYNYLSDILIIINNLSEDDRGYILDKLCNSIENGDVLDGRSASNDINKIYLFKYQYIWFEKIINKLDSKIIPF